MKYIDINRKFTETVSSYIAQGYIINTASMSGSQGEIAHIDLTDGKQIVRVLLDSFTEDEVQEWFMWNRYMTATPSQYDCTGQLFTNWFKLTRRRGHWFAYHSISRDV